MLTVCLALWASLAAASTPTAMSKTVEFVGFSANESVSAWRTTRTVPQASGDLDRFSLVTLVDTKTNQLLATLRDSTIRRTDAAGRPRRAAEATLATANPAYQAALPRATWRKLKREGRFWAARLPLKDSTVRLLADDDTELTVTNAKKQLSVTTPSGMPLGYTVVGRLMDGTFMLLGHFRHAALPYAPMLATVEVSVSHSGKSIAVLNRFTPGADGDLPAETTSEGIVVSSPAQALGATAVGALNMLNVYNKSVEDIFLGLHPEAKADYGTFVGKRY